MSAAVQRWDEAVLRWIAGHLRAEWLDPVMTVYTNLGNAGLLFIALAVVLIALKKTRRAGLSAGAAMAAGLLVTNLIVKPLAARPRPWVVMEGWQTLVTSHDPNSFPSGHTTAAFAFAVALCAVIPSKKGRTAALIAAVLMGFSRLYVGVHFPTDVLAGAVIGSLCGWLGAWLIGRIIRRRKAVK